MGIGDWGLGIGEWTFWLSRMLPVSRNADTASGIPPITRKLLYNISKKAIEKELVV